MSESFVNNYTPPPPAKIPAEISNESYGPSPYDINFVFPIDLTSNPDLLSTPRVRLTPLIPRLHAQTYITVLTAHPELARYLPSHFTTLAEFLHFLEHGVRRDRNWCLFAILDKGTSKEREGKGETMAGLIGLVKSDAPNLTTEIGFVVTFPEFQRTYVTTNAVCILLRYALELPSRFPGALGLRRVEWRANSRNEPSKKAAKRIGFKDEGVLRWHIVLPEAKEGDAPREGDPKAQNLKRDTALFSACCDDWESGLREKVQEMIGQEC